MGTLKDYFENTKGMGVMATADKEGKVDAAIEPAPRRGQDSQLPPHALGQKDTALVPRTRGRPPNHGKAQ